MNLIISSILLWLVLAFSSIISLHFATAFRNNSLMIILLNNPFTRVFYFASSRFTIIISVCSNIKGFLIISHIVLVFQSPPRLVLILFQLNNQGPYLQIALFVYIKINCIVSDSEASIRGKFAESSQ